MSTSVSGHPSPPDILRRVFGFPAFRGLQQQVVEHVSAGGDALVLMPTGGGKSVCYQLPALVREGCGVVVSPLIALMDDQVAALRQLGVAAGALHSELDYDEVRATNRALDAGKLDLLYVSPERLLGGGLLERLSRQTIALVAIDEAHCVSQWGHEFRPEYRELASIPHHFPGVPRIALTATADPRTRADILQVLGMADAKVFAASFHRENLHLAAEPKVGETTQLLAFLAAHRGQTGIIYCGSRAKTERTTQKLLEKGFSAIGFHGGMAAAEKRAGLQRFRSGEAVTMVATIAFGMGIDRPDVRFVVHLDMPDSPEAFYQQIGRAGRDGERADILLLYGGEDISRARYWLGQSAAPDQQKRVMRERLEAMISLTETVQCRTRRLLGWFDERLDGRCGHCDNCATPQTQFDGTIEAQKVLSAVYRTGQMFGALHIISVLTGSATDMVKRYHHDKLAVFGVGADQPENFWRGVIRQLIAYGALATGEELATLSLVPDIARPLLRGEKAFMLRNERPQAKPPKPARGKAEPVTTTAPSGVFEALREWRANEARVQKLPPYVIFHDTVLREIAAVRPRDLDELGQIKGVGSSKLERYGAQILSQLRAYAGATP